MVERNYDFNFGWISGNLHRFVNWNVAVYKGLFLELPSGHVIVNTVYKQLCM